MPLSQTVADATDHLYPKVSNHYKKEYWEHLAPLIAEINALKKQKNAVILGHNYMTPDIFHCVSDIVGDSLKLAQEAAATKADIIVQAGVHFMAETSKILCPDKTVLMPDMEAGCSLAEGITAQDVLDLKRDHPGVPVVTYVNTSAEVKAESDICCTSSNAVKIVKRLVAEGHKRVLCIPDQYLAQNVARQVPEVEVLTFAGACIVHEIFSAKDIDRMRSQNPDAVILTHPECPPDAVKASDFSGSTSQINQYIIDKQPAKAILVTECSMSDNIAADNPNVELIKGCQLCPHMKRITLPKILKSLQTETTAVEVDPAIAARALIAVQKMLEYSQ